MTALRRTTGPGCASPGTRGRRAPGLGASARATTSTPASLEVCTTAVASLFGRRL